ncbi:ankyrin repeat, SAM and basic leucine zipper domain-containing protein 1-like [Actinia tenebrosa]|uniref:Ankyrin repeat, SAM and basic leucine zipper domain-containing protein 1 n=1 Tax=Actinia tenebrosa TaxID=6105 RepID=A0A6P8ISL6_ACTTE|nr:ankyrin repeat, SAM and basic leucine zipper domain-containing protein 1-like [Actinia tenebrosa]
MSFIPAGFEDSDDDDFDFDESDFSEFTRKQTRIETEKPLQRNQNHTAGPSAVQPSVGRGRGVFRESGQHTRSRGGFGMPPSASTARQHTSPSSHFPKTSHKSPIKPRDSGPNPILLDDMKNAAVKGNKVGVVKLLDQGIGVDTILRSGWTALLHAANAGADDVVELLLKKGANANFQKDMYTVLMAACDADSVADEDKVLHCVEMLLEHGAKIGFYDRHRMSPLMYAARQGRVAVCERLLEKGAQINKTDGRGWTALSWAASRGHGRLIRVLLDHKADPKLYSLDGQAPSDIAYSSGYPIIAGILEATASGTLGARAELMLLSGEADKATDASASLETYGGLEVLLCGIELGHLVPKFKEHKITFESFAKMTEKDLDQLEITQVGVRQKILDAIRDIHVKEWDTSSLQQQKNLLSAPEVTSVIANINKHLTVIHSSIVYATKQLDEVVNPTEFVQDVSEVEGLSFFAKEALKTSEDLHEDILGLQRKCTELMSQTGHLSADLISSEPHPPASTSKGGLIVIGIAAVTLGIIYAKKSGMLT